MSEEDKAEGEVLEGEALKETPGENQTEASFNPDKQLKMGYMVGVDQSDEFFFQIFGTNRTMVNLLGIHQHATSTIEQQCRRIRGEDKIQEEILKAILLLNQRLEQVVQGFQRPKNKLE